MEESEIKKAIKAHWPYLGPGKKTLSGPLEFVVDLQGNTVVQPNSLVAIFHSDKLLCQSSAKNIIESFESFQTRMRSQAIEEIVSKSSLGSVLAQFLGAIKSGNTPPKKPKLSKSAAEQLSEMLGSGGGAPETMEQLSH